MLLNRLSRQHAALYMRLHTSHVPLATYLARIRCTLSPACPTCRQGHETVYHFLWEWGTYSLHRAVYLGTLCRTDTSVQYLLTSDEAVRPLFKYINATAPFRRIFGVFKDIREPEQ